MSKTADLEAEVVRLTNDLEAVKAQDAFIADSITEYIEDFVRFCDDSLNVAPSELHYDRRWEAEVRRRLVVLRAMVP